MTATFSLDASNFKFLIQQPIPPKSSHNQRTIYSERPENLAMEIVVCVPFIKKLKVPYGQKVCLLTFKLTQLLREHA